MLSESSEAQRIADPIGTTRQIIVVTTSGWSAVPGTMQRFGRRSANAPWVRVGDAVPVVVGRTGLALGAEFQTLDTHAPVKREGDGKAPAGVFPLRRAFGFAPAHEAKGVKLPYVELTDGMDCVDDTASVHYNTLIDRAKVKSVDWTSAEHMRQVAQYEQGVVVDYNAPRVTRGSGSCIFLHIWNGPASHTAGCTAFDAGELRRIVEWLDPRRAPKLVQFPSATYDLVRERWKLPAVDGR